MYYENIEYASSVNEGRIVTTIMVIYMLLLATLLIGAIADYLLRGFGMYKMGKAQGKSNSWLAFVPFARTYFQGELSGAIHFKKKSIKNPGIWMIVIPIIANVAVGMFYFIFVMIMMVTSVGSVTSGNEYGMQSVVSGLISGFIVFLIVFIIFAVIYQAVLQVLYVLVNRQIYDRYTDGNMAVVHAVLGAVVPLYEPICMFVFGRNAEKEMEAKELEDKTE